MDKKQSNGLDPQTGLSGFICPRDGEKVSFQSCANSCPNPCRPLPLLMSLVNERQPEEGVYHVTEILSPPQQVHLKRTQPYWAEPDSLVWTSFGRSWHGLIESQKHRIEELGLEGEFVIEKSFEAEIQTPNGLALLRGRPDLYITSKKQLFDFKTMKRYTASLLLSTGDWSKDTYHWQLNIYKTYCFPEAEELILECLIKDWRRKEWDFKKRELVMNDLRPIERLYAPVIHESKVKQYVEVLLGYLLMVERGEIEPRPCLTSELWIQEDRKTKAKTLLRCEEYCVVKDVCPQYPKLCEEYYGRKDQTTRLGL